MSGTCRQFVFFFSFDLVLIVTHRSVVRVGGILQALVGCCPFIDASVKLVFGAGGQGEGEGEGDEEQYFCKLHDISFNGVGAHRKSEAEPVCCRLVDSNYFF